MVTARAVTAGVSATPTVLVAGVQVQAESRAIALAVDQVGAPDVDLSWPRPGRDADDELVIIR